MTEGADAAGRGSASVSERERPQLENGFDASHENKAEEPIVETVEPKVFATYEDRPGEVPRRIQVERCKRKFAAIDLNAKLRDLNVIKLMAASLLDDKLTDGNQMPLELFDNADFDDRPLQMWAELVCTKHVTARAMRAGASKTNRWQPCFVKGFDHKSGKFEVMFEGAGAPELLSRLYICFDAEDPMLYVERLFAAIDRRKTVQMNILLSLYADNMPMDNLKPLDSEQVNRVVQKSTQVRSLKDRSTDTSTLIQEFSMNHMRTLNTMVIRQLICSRFHDELLLTIPFRDLPPFDPIFSKPKYVATEAEASFAEKKEDFCFFSLLTKPEIVRILIATQKENYQLEAQTFFTSSSKALRLEEFVHVQHTSVTAMRNFIKDTWAKMHVMTVQANLRDIRKGWFNLNESDIEVYRFSKLKRFLTRTNFVMEDYLRDLIVRSLENYAKYVERFATVQAIVLSCSEVKLQSREDVENAEYTPMLTVELKIIPSDPHAIGFASSSKDILSAVLHQFDEPFSVARNVLTVERNVMGKLFWSHDPVLQIPTLSEPRIQKLREDLQHTVQTALAPMDEYLETFSLHRELALLNVDTFVKSCAEKYCNPDNLRLQELYKLVIEQKEKREQLDTTIPPRMDLGFIRVSNESIRKTLGDKQDEIVRKLNAVLVESVQAHARKVSEQFEDIHRRLKVYPANIESLMEVKDYAATIPAQIDAIAPQVQQNNNHLELTERLHIHLPYDVMSVSWDIIGWPKRLQHELLVQVDELEVIRKRYQREMEDDQISFEDSVRQLQLEIQALRSCTDIRMHEETATKIQALKIQLDDAEAQVKLFNSREDLFGRDHTEYTVLNETQRLFEPYSDAWTSIHKWLSSEQSWMHSPFTSLNAEEIERSVAEIARLVQRSTKYFEKNGAQEYLVMLADVKCKVEDFKPFVPVITALRNPGMRDRHWHELSEAIGTKLVPNAAFTLETIISMGLHTHVEDITRISEKAAKEFSIETALVKMEQAWAGLRLRIEPYRSTGTSILKGIDELITLLDEHVTMTQTMAFSAFKGPFEERIESWNRTLQTVSEVIDEWVTLQRSWLYLQPIFDSADINKQLPQEGKRFSTVDKYWRQIMANAGRGALAIKFCDDLKLLDRLREGSKLLELVQKGLSDYLETKRAGFSRFYFLSDDELLEILSESKDPLRVQPHLKKCFEGIKTVDFQDDLKITAMNSAEKEKVPFVRPVDPVDKNIEHWMVDVNDQMCISIRHQMISAVEGYLSTPRVDWIQQWPAQVVINGSQIHWTREVEEALSVNGRDGIVEYYDKLVSQLTDMVVLIRNPLPESTRMTVGALAVIDVHARDVVKQMIEADVQRTTDFDWISQMRFYWEGDRENGDVAVLMVSSKQPYGYEYLGNSARLVITPLTDKCYLTIMGALQMILGGAPVGPAGTGKTETTKDLAKALAKQCVVYNCSDGLDYLGMGKMFKGLASSGAWACFDEFNRINIEVLSVIAQQIMNLQHAVQAGEKRLFFEGTDISVSPYFAVFITMNPGYAGRTELPDNLEALFRPVAMMVPDYALIAEIMLFSYGYMENRKCAKKMVATFRLCSEQLSSQDHYDYGMRAVKTVITTAGNLKRVYPDEHEEALLLRALQDVNVPKFLAHDLPLFDGILSDLFPGMSRPPSNYGPLKSAIYEAIEEQALQPVPVFVRKNIELYEMVCVRHGLMVVGPTGGGKSNTVQVLEQALSKLKASGVTGPRYEQVNKFHLNPKSITMGQLYGQFDPNTREWQDGVLCGIVRDCIRQEDSTLKWVLFDGPVDALWIENMNTVLDDNKKLCLTSGEIMVLTNEMTMMFEVEDLSVASPATVSRCGMVYMEPTSLGYDPLVQSWLQHEANLLNDELKARLRTLFDQLVTSCLDFLRKYCVEPLETANNALIENLLNLLECFIFEPHNPHMADERRLPRSLNVEQLDALFLFCLLWSIGCTSDAVGRQQFEAFVREEASNHAMKLALPKSRSLYEYKYDFHESTWVHWNDTVPAYIFDPKLPYSELTVPTVDSICYTFLLDLLVCNNKHVLMTGPTGTGKTVNISTHLQQGFSDKYIPITFTFSAQTSANQTQDLIDSKCEKRRKGVYGPQVGKQLLIFIDDVNMPQREFYGAQPPIELLRQWFDGGGWYDRKSLNFRNIVDVTFVAACGPPGGGRNPITARFLRHFNIVTYTPMNEASMFQIFSTIFCNALTNFDESLQVLGESFVQAAIDVFSTVARELRPTPTKPHYTFNLRDISKVFQGMLMMSNRRVTSAAQLARMWIHENSRVYADRLVNAEDAEWFRQLLSRKLEDRTQMTWDEALSGREHIICSDFLIPGADPRLYEEVDELDALQSTIEDYLSEYNSNSKQPMHLVLFRDALEHVTRICRVLRQPSGNALLLGIGGSGRQSLTRLAASISGYEIFQIEITKGYGMPEWRENLRECLMKAGVQDRPVIFLFNDTQIVDESMLEDINSILNSGDVPNLYGAEEMEAISAACKPDCVRKRIPPTKLNIFAQFLNRVKRNIHVVLCMSPLGAPFRTRLRMFPSIVNCCTIDWFAEWPPEALQSVAASFIGEANLELGELEPLVIQFVQHIHTDVARASHAYAQQQGRHFYVTPTTYLELLATYQSVLKFKRNEIGTLRSRLEAGLLKLISTAEQVQALQDQLTKMEPELVATQVEVEAMIVQIGIDKEEAAVVQRKVAQEESVAQQKAAQTKEIADDAQRDLDEALPALDEAVACLSELKKTDIDEVRSLGKPPRGVLMTIEACCIMFDIPPEKVKDPDNPLKKINDFFKSAQKTILSNANKLLADMKDFDRDNIPPAVIDKIAPYIDNEEFQPDVIARASKACRAMCMWVRAMYKYHQVAIMVEPKKEQLRMAQQSLDETLATLSEAQARLKENTDKIEALEEAFQEASDRKERLAFDVEECRARLDRAQKLIGGLGGERARWTQEVADLQVRYKQLVGDALICSGSVSYLGAFTPDFRNSLVAEWQKKLNEAQLPHSADCNLRSVLADAVLVRQWNLCGLPNDVQSVENGMIMHHGRRYPLLIDPQGQANRFIKLMGKDTSLCPNAIDVVKLSDKNFLRTLENGVRFGRWVLLENVEETLDAALEPLLLQQRFKQGGTEMIKLGDNTIPWNDSFKFFITTKLSNPHYPPEICVKVSLINFAVTFSGLEDQLLGVVVVEEMPELEQKKNSLVIANAKMKKELKEIEDKILYMLSNSTGNILDDHELIDTLASSKKTSEEIAVKVEEAETTEKHIDESREKYRSIAYRGAILYFCITDLSAVDPMYQYSIQWFKALFVQAIRLAEASDQLEQRLQNLTDFFTYYVYVNICRSLFERHKLLFSFLMLIRVLQGDRRINNAEWQFLISGKTPSTLAMENPAPDWIDKRMWDEVQSLSSLPSFKGFGEHLQSSTQLWKELYDNLEPHKLPLPGHWNASLTSFQKLCVLRCLRADKCPEAIMDYIMSQSGSRFVEPPPFDLEGCFKDSSPFTPLIFILSKGSDPTKAFQEFSARMKMDRKIAGLSLGQGQGPKAARLIQEACQKGTWVYLQNCHLHVSWLTELERICESFTPETVHRDFRLWLTSMPCKEFPVTLLQNGVKMTNEPPKGLKANLRNSYYNLDDDALNSTTKPAEYRFLLFGLCFFHAVVQERRKFGALGWNIPYEFNNTDLDISNGQLKSFLDQYDEIPYRVLTFLTSYINYGGRVTDYIDLRTIDVIMRDYYKPEILRPNYRFDENGVYFSFDADPSRPQQSYLEYIESLPFIADPGVFGLHDNANISSALLETFGIFDTLLSLQPKEDSSSGASREETVAAVARSTLTALQKRGQFDVQAISMQYPVVYSESMNTVLIQECIRYNRLIEEMEKSLPELIMALNGLVVMSGELEEMANRIMLQQVPLAWEAKAYPSLKPLAPWVDDLMMRLDFILQWIADGIPPVFWISGFYFPQAFLTGTLQNYARKYKIPIDTVEFDFILLDTPWDTITARPDDGVYIRGLYLEGARWDPQAYSLNDCFPKKLFESLPVIHLLPEQNRPEKTSAIYRCPVYKILSRRGTLSTTGHSTNFIMWIELPSDRRDFTNNLGKADQDTWIKAGVAAFCSLRY